MMEVLVLIFFGVLLCFGVLPGLLLGLMLRRRPRMPVAPSVLVDPLTVVAGQIDAWVAEERLSPVVGATIQRLIAADRATQQAAKVAAVPAAPALAPVAPPPAPVATVPLVSNEADTLPALSAPINVEPVTTALLLPRVAPSSPVTADLSAPLAAIDAGDPLGTKPPQHHQFAGALLALGTRRTLLYLGTFLLVLSGLTLVVFNWASFAPIVQTALLAGIMVAFGGGGTWMTQRRDLARAGSNLQAVAGLLVPVVLFAATRPGMLDLAPRTGWFLAALGCLPLYTLAAWRTHNSFYSVAASLAGINMLLAGMSDVASGWLPTFLICLLIGYMLLARRLELIGRTDLALGPYWTAQIAAPLAALIAVPLGFSALASDTAVVGAWAILALFYCVVAAQEDRAVWAWTAALLVPIAVYANISVWPVLRDLALEAPILAALAVANLHIALFLRPRRPNLWVAPLLVAPLLSLLVLNGTLFSVPDARLSLPLLICGGLLLIRAVRNGRLDDLKIAAADLDLLGFLIASALLPIWIGTLLVLAPISAGLFWLVMLALALPIFVASQWWPGSLRIAYANTLQVIGTGLLVVASGVLVSEPAVWVPATLWLTVICGTQAWLRRHVVWVVLALVSAVLVGGALLDRSAWADTATAWQLVGLAYTSGYALAATFFRGRMRLEWLRPTLLGSALIGSLTTVAALLTVVSPGGPTVGSSLTLVLLGSLLVGLSRSWGAAWLGYPAVGLLTSGILAAAVQGFFSGWQPGGALAYVCLLVGVSFGVVGLWLRRHAPLFARPYVLAAFVLLPLAPLAAGGSAPHLTFTWVALFVVYALATERYRQPWLSLVSWLCLDLFVMQGMSWQFPALGVAQLGLVLTGLAWLQGASALVFRRHPRSTGFHAALSVAAYVALALSSLGALLLTLREPSALAVGAFVLLILLVLIALLDQQALAAWFSLPLLVLGMMGLQHLYELSLANRLLSATSVALALTVVGWMLGLHPLRMARIFMAPLRFPPLGVGLFCGSVLAGLQLLRDDPRGLSLALALSALLWAVGGLRERQRWAILPALSSTNLALISVLIPPNAAFPFLLNISVAFGLAVLEGGLAVTLRRSARSAGLTQLGLPIYFAAALMAGLALALSLSAPERVAAVALGLAILVGTLTTLERREVGVWAVLGFSLLAFIAFGQAQAWGAEWMAAWLPLALILLMLVGLLLERLSFAFWRRPTTWGIVVSSGLMIFALYGNGFALLDADLDLLAVALALCNLGLLWATVAVRLRTLHLGYAAGAAFIGAALCRLADLGVAESQWYVLPAGIYLLVLADGVRRFQGRRQASQALELAAALLILASSFAQALRVPGGPGYELLLFGEALALIAYGILVRLRIPFVTGIAFFVLGAGWLALEASRGFNQWVLLGIFGLLMIVAYVVLERHQERLVRMGRTWMAQIRAWA